MASTDDPASSKPTTTTPFNLLAALRHCPKASLFGLCFEGYPLPANRRDTGGFGGGHGGGGEVELVVVVVVVAGGANVP